MMDLSKEVLHTIKKNELLRRADTVIVGVSGGADSISLLHILSQLKHDLGIQIHVAHFNHRLRLSADRDEAFVRVFAKKLNLPITVGIRSGKLKVKTVSEDQARQWRFAFFLKVARQQKASVIALAHNQNDLAETVLMRILRGSGLSGLKSIQMKQEIEGCVFIRPLLSTSRSRIEEYLKKNKLKFCFDETNDQTHYLRNKIRLELLPKLLKEYNNNLTSVLVDLASTSGEDYDYLLLQARLKFKKLAKISKITVRFNVKSFMKEHLSMRRMLLRLAFEHLTDDLNQLSFKHIQEVEDCTLGAQVHWPRSLKVLMSASEIVVRCCK